MRSNFSAPAACILLCFLFAQTSFSKSSVWTYLKEDAKTLNEHVKLEVVSSTDGETELVFRLDAFTQTTVLTTQGQAVTIGSSELSRILQAGAPDLGKMAFSLSIPDDAKMEIEIIHTEFTSYPNIPVAPSRGNLYRNMDPSLVPYSYGNAYSQNSFYPGKLAELKEPYILRDVRGQAVWVYPFQYNPVTRELQVYSEIHFRVKAAGISTVNSLTRFAPPTTVDPVFSAIYRSHFVNPPSVLYTPVEESGKMLVVCYDPYLTTMQPFVDWKNRMGQPTEMVAMSTIGTNSTHLKNFIVDYYNSNGLTFLLLVGDAAQVPVAITIYGDSDPSLGYILGNDSYGEVIVGRFSAETVEQVQTQVQRTLTYEMNPDPSGQWYGKGVCIGSDQGPGDDNEMDFEHERVIRTDELAYTYTVADELYDGSQGLMDASGDPSPADLEASLNDGRGVITYTGHGSTNAFSTTGFSSGDVSSLTNTNQLPFIWSVACVNGEFNGSTCLAESFLRATDVNGDPTGAVATFMSTINQSWNPPMDAQDEFIDLLTEQYPVNVKHSFGGISVNGCMHMNDQYGSSGDEMTDTWTCFGDPSLVVRTTTPQPVTVSHSPFIDETDISFPVNCNADGALICLSRNSEIIATGHSLLGICNLNGISGLVPGEVLDLTVTGYNRMPYFGTVSVTSITAVNETVAGLTHFHVYPSGGGYFTTAWSLEQDSDAKLELTNVLGKEILVFEKARGSKGSHSLSLDLNGVVPGMYLLNLISGGQTLTRKLIVQ